MDFRKNMGVLGVFFHFQYVQYCSKAVCDRGDKGPSDGCGKDVEPFVISIITEALMVCDVSEVKRLQDDEKKKEKKKQWPST